jgi:hypothetical protein
VGRVDLLARLLLCRVGERVTEGVEGAAHVDVELEAFVGPGVVDLDGDLRSLVPVQGDVDRVVVRCASSLSGFVVVWVMLFLLAREQAVLRDSSFANGSVSMTDASGGRGLPCPRSFGWLEHDSATKAAGGESLMGGPDGLERMRYRDAEPEAVGVDERGKLGEPGRVGADPDVLHARAAQRERRGAGGHGHERAAIVHRVQRRYCDERRVERPLDASRSDVADGGAELFGAGNELVCAKPRDERLVLGSGDRDRAHSAQRGELEREPAERAGRSGDQQPLAGLQGEQVERLQRGESVEWKRRPSTGEALRGAGATASVSSTTCSACAPIAALSRWCMPTTQSPISYRSTVGPTASITPARSQPIPVWPLATISPCSASQPARVAMSTGFTAAASTRIRTCPGPGLRDGDFGDLEDLRAAEATNDHGFHQLPPSSHPSAGSRNEDGASPAGTDAAFAVDARSRLLVGGRALE